MRLLFLMNTLCIVIVNKLESEEIKQPKQNRGILDHKGLLHCKAEMAASHFESRCHSRAADNKPIFMVMDAFGMVSVESDKAKMSCHGLVIVLGTACTCCTWEDEYSIQWRGTLKGKRGLLSYGFLKRFKFDIFHTL